MWITGGSDATARPEDGRLLLVGSRPAWIVGDADCRVVRDGYVQLAVVGSCYATDTELRRGAEAVRQGQWRDLTTWPGSYWVLSDNGQRTSIMTDVPGTRPIYYATYRNATVWASMATPLAELISAGVDFTALLA